MAEETVSEVLAQSNTKTPDFMAPVLLPNPQPFQEGGIASLPNSPVLAGQQHMLAYITPEEASRLRAQGGGVTPTGGQYRGPGGIASFVVGGSTATSSPPSGQAQASTPGNVGTASTSSPPTGLAHGKFGLGDPPEVDVDARSDAKFKNIVLKFSQYALAKAEAEDKAEYGDDPSFDTDRRSEVKNAMRRAQIRMRAIRDGFVPGLQSQANLAASIGETDALGNTTLGYIDYSTMRRYTRSDIEAMSVHTFNSIFTGNSDISPIGDPKSPLGQAVTGLSTFALSLFSPALTLPTMAIDALSGTGLMGLLSTGYKGLVGETPEQTFGDVSQEVLGTRTPFGDVTGYISNQLGLSDAVSQIGNVLGTPTPSTVTTPYSPGGPGLPAIQSTGIPPVNIGGFLPTTTETLLDATSSYYDAQQLADATGW